MVKNSGLVFIILVWSCRYTHTQNAPSVITSSGKIIGHYLISPSGKPYKAFEGIPYAMAPKDSLRFEEPIPIKPWRGEFLANKFQGMCMGFSRGFTDLTFSVEGTEDCLYLNVYVPGHKVNTVMPVIFWIYGGAFQTSSLTGAEQRYLIDNEVVFVSFNHRHGVLGFLSTEDAVVPGNMGLKDQALALKWVYNNIQNFGGNPNQINLIGFSSGAASVHYHYLSPWTAGMFSSGISISGTALNSWAQIKNSRMNAIRIAENLKCPTLDMNDMIICLKQHPAKTLMMAQAMFYPWILYDIIAFGPVVEKSGKKPFIDQDPIDIINAGKAQKRPWITGIVSDEGLLNIAGFITNSTALQELDKNWISIAPDLLGYKFFIPKEQHAQAAKRIRKHYLGDKPILSTNVHNVVRMLTDAQYAVVAEKAAKAMAKANPKLNWLYYYSYTAANSVSMIIINQTNPKTLGMKFGPSHADDVFLTFKSFPSGPPLTKEDLSMQDKLVKFWISVTKTKSPNFVPAWPTVDNLKLDLDYLHMAGPGNLQPKCFSNFGDNIFWKSINFSNNFP